MIDKHTKQVKHVAYRWLVRPVARLVILAVIAGAFAYGAMEQDIYRTKGKARADAGLVFIAMLVPGLIIGGLVVALPGWIYRANKNSTKDD